MFWMLVVISTAFSNAALAAPATTAATEILITDHFKDILSIIPKDLIKNITYKHLKTDDGFKAAVKFMQTDEWNNRVKIIREKPEWISLKKYMKNIGINMDVFIKCAEGLLRNVTVTLDPNKPLPKKSIKAFLIDVEENLPTMKILTALHEKMMQNTKLQHLFDKIASTDTRKMIDNILALPEIKSFIKDMADMDLDITEVLALVYSFLGWGELRVDW